MIHCFSSALKVSEILPYYPGSLIRVHNSLSSIKASSILEKEEGLTVVVAEKELPLEM